MNKISTLLLAILIAFGASAQSKKELEKQRKKAEAQIAFTKKILRETSSKKQKSMREVKAIKRLIEARETLLKTISSEITLVAHEASEKKYEIDSLNLVIESEKKKYAKAIVRSYKGQRIYNNTMFLFTATSFNQLIMRMKFIRYLSAAKEKYMNSIYEKKNVLTSKFEELLNLKKEKESLAENKKLEVKELETDKSRKDKVVRALDGKESELRSKLKKQQSARDLLDRKIKAIVAEEIRKAKEKAEKEKQKEGKPKADGVHTVTPEVKQLSNNFAANKGKLPWPVEKGFISDHFGTHAHEKLDHVTVENNGVDIQTTKGSKARCIHKGTVTAIITIPGMGKAVLVNHGEYFTVYSKLSSVSVSQGQTVSLKQEIGTIMEEEDGSTVIHLEIWYNQEKQNPEAWIAKK